MKNRANVWRLIQTGFAIVLVFLLLNTWLGRQYQSQLLLAQQTDEQIMLLSDQTLSAVTPLLKFKHTAELQQLAQRLVADPRFISASIFSDSGERLAFAQSIYLDAQEFSDDTLQQALARFPVTTEFVQQGDERLGFIRFRIDRDQFFSAIAAQHRTQQQQLLLMLLMAGLCGATLARALSFKRAHYQRHIFAQQKAALASGQARPKTAVGSDKATTKPATPNNVAELSEPKAEQSTAYAETPSAAQTATSAKAIEPAAEPPKADDSAKTDEATPSVKPEPKKAAAK